MSTSNGVAVRDRQQRQRHTTALDSTTRVFSTLPEQNTSLTLGGAIDNTGTISLNSDNNYRSTLTVDANGVTLEGSGTVALSDSVYNYVSGAAAGDKLINVNNTFEGAGQLGDGA